MKEVSKDIIKAATIVTKWLTVLDKITQDGHPDVAHELHMLNGALTLLGNANHRNNLTHRFIIKREINQKYAHLCSEKVPLTRFLFGDDVSICQAHQGVWETETQNNNEETVSKLEIQCRKSEAPLGKPPTEDSRPGSIPIASGHWNNHRQSFPQQASEAKKSLKAGDTTTPGNNWGET